MKIADTIDLGGADGPVKFYDLAPRFSLNGLTAKVAALFGVEVGHVANALSVDLDFFSQGYYENKPGGHWGLMLRANTEASTMGGEYQGHGPIFWSLNRKGVPPQQAEIEHARSIEMPLHGPVAQLEEWGVPPGCRFLYPASVSPTLEDHVQYKLHAASVQDITGNRFVGYSLYRYTGAPKHAWDMLYVTGDVLSNNGSIDMLSQRFALFDAAPQGLGSIKISNLHASYMAADRRQADLTASAYP
jgi:hypothetical protein